MASIFDARIASAERHEIDQIAGFAAFDRLRQNDEAIGCRQGMEVGGDVESLGRRVTSAVVHAIFSIILLDAIFAMVYSELDL